MEIDQDVPLKAPWSLGTFVIFPVLRAVFTNVYQRIETPT